MEIKVARQAGFCFGVKRALQLVEGALSSYPAVHTLGPIIHNSRVVEELRQRGLVPVLDPANLNSGAVVVLPTHGIPQGLRQELESRGVILIDAICPFVQRAQELVAELAGQGYWVVLVGDAEHPEVIGLRSYADERVQVVAEPEGLLHTEFPPSVPLAVLSQTTQSEANWRAVVERLQALGYAVKEFSTICEATLQRQKEAEELARQVDLLLVIGGKNSANTTRLYQLVRKFVPAQQMENIPELDPAILQGKQRIGIISGASTPEWQVAEVVKYLKEITDSPAELLPNKSAPEISQLPENTVGEKNEPAKDGLSIQPSSARTTDNLEDELTEEWNPEQLLLPREEASSGDIILSRVVEMTPDMVVVDLGLKAEGMISREEFPPEFIERIGLIKGISIPVLILRKHTMEGVPRVSYQAARRTLAQENLRQAQEQGLPVDGLILRRIKGGFVVDVGLEAFLPLSQVDRHGLGPDWEHWLKLRIRAAINECDWTRGNIVISRRKLQEIEQARQRQELLLRLNEGMTVEGKVSGLTDFGAFIDLGGFEGLLHLNDISWGRLLRVKDVLKKGERLKLKVLKVDRENEKVLLGRKQLLPYPWDEAKNRYKVGTVVRGKVVAMTEFGAFLELEPGVEGLLHISELSWHKRIKHPREILHFHQQLRVKVITFDQAQERIGLSLKRLEKSPWEEFAERNPVGSRVKGRVSRLLPFGALVQIPGTDLEGLIHLDDFSWMHRFHHPREKLREGEEIEAVVRQVDLENGKIFLSLKDLIDDPFLRYKAGTVIETKVKQILDFGIIVELDDGIEGFIHISEIALAKVKHPAEAVKPQERIMAKVLRTDRQKRRIELSIKRYEHDQEQKEMAKYIESSDYPTLGEVLDDKWNKE